MLDNNFEKALEMLRNNIEMLERQLNYLNRLSLERQINDELVDEKIRKLSSRVQELERALDNINETFHEQEPTTSKDANNVDENKSKDWVIGVLIAAIGFLAGPIVEIVKYLLK